MLNGGYTTLNLHNDFQKMVGQLSYKALQLGNGWLVVKNLDYMAKDWSLKNENLQEADFLSVWPLVSKSPFGVLRHDHFIQVDEGALQSVLAAG